MLRKARFLHENIRLLCYDYKSFHLGAEDEHYKVAESKPDKILDLILKLEKNLTIRTAGNIRDEQDCPEYEKNLKSIVKEMRLLIKDSTLKKEMKFIYEFIRSRPVNHNTKIQHDENYVYYAAYMYRK